MKIDNNEKVELLAPAGNYESFLGAINAGADAVYLAGNQFGARAYAGNFSTDELMKALEYAHLLGKKIYLTLNTLIKQNEWSGIDDFLLPFYENGLDGIIIQDLGVITHIREQFPYLPIHVSTQVSAANIYAINQLQRLGAVRIVPARELTLPEIKEIHSTNSIELETFIHGAICYSYSGQCLFSSILGGRSGNRGRCAQPCRLPYHTDKKDAYYLSMKDMCTIEILPELIQAGISSFKIEGRMKSPEYAAGVTAIYRKYIDLYMENTQKPWKVAREDIDFLNKMYIRKEINTGYYERRNGMNMITLDDPSYLPLDDRLCESVRSKYLGTEKEQKLKVGIYVRCKINQPIQCILTMMNQKETDTDITRAETCGVIVQAAQNAPVSEEMLKKQICKMGNTPFVAEHVEVELEQNCFVLMKEINELRREAVKRLEQTLLQSYRREQDNSSIVPKNEINKDDTTDTTSIPSNKNLIYTEVTTVEQLKLCISYSEIKRIYIDYDLYLSHKEEIEKLMIKSNVEGEIYLSLPHILRQDRIYQFQKLMDDSIKTEWISGYLVRDLGEAEYIRKQNSDKLVITDANLYAFNREAANTIMNSISEEYTIPYELNKGEMTDLPRKNAEFIVYSHIPLMVSANCVKKTDGKCDHHSGYISMTDRQSHTMQVKTYCRDCYNIIYNSIPMSLHGKMQDIKKRGYHALRIQLLNEDDVQAEHILRAFLYNEPLDDEKEYTNGHYNRGVQ